MQISGHGRSAELAKLLLGIQEAEGPAARKQTAAEGRRDYVQISDQAKELARIKALADQPDQERAERVERLRRAVESGTYHVTGRTVGDAVIRHVLMDAVL